MKDEVEDFLTSQFGTKPKGIKPSATAVPKSIGPQPIPAQAVDCHVHPDLPIPSRIPVAQQTKELLGKLPKKRKHVHFASHPGDSAYATSSQHPLEPKQKVFCRVNQPEPIQCQSETTEPSAPSEPSEPLCQSIWPSNYLKEIKRIVSTPSKEMSKPDITFELTKEAAHKNFLVLKKHKLNMQQLIESQADTPMYYGSEFRETQLLEPLLERHPNWTHLKSILENGSN